MKPFTGDILVFLIVEWIGVVVILIFVTLEVMIFIELSEGYSKYALNEQAVGASGGSWADGDAGTYD